MVLVKNKNEDSSFNFKQYSAVRKTIALTFVSYFNKVIMLSPAISVNQVIKNAND